MYLILRGFYLNRILDYKSNILVPVQVSKKLLVKLLII